MKRNLTTLLAVALLLGCQAAPTSDAAFPANAIAATAHPVATDVARDIFERGGNAADAAVAAGFALAVTEPSMSHLGGRIQILVRTADGRYEGYNGMTEVPAGYVPPDVPVSQGYGTIATPGVVAGLARLHAEHGSLPWPELRERRRASRATATPCFRGGLSDTNRASSSSETMPGFNPYSSRKTAPPTTPATSSGSHGSRTRSIAWPKPAPTISIAAASPRRSRPTWPPTAAT